MVTWDLKWHVPIYWRFYREYFHHFDVRFLQNITLPFLKNDSMDSIVQLSIAGTTLDHRDANMSVMKFLVELIKCTYVDQVLPVVSIHSDYNSCHSSRFCCRNFRKEDCHLYMSFLFKSLMSHTCHNSGTNILTWTLE